MIPIVVHGARGRMGERICALVEKDARFELRAKVDQGLPGPIDAPSNGEVIVDFSSAEGSRSAVQLAVERRSALLVGTTGHSREIVDLLEDSARSIAVMIAPNTSLGVAVISHLVAEAARRLGPGFDIDIVETHHTHKKDAPSGTALRLARALDGVGRPVESERIHALRAGDVVGEHSVIFSGPGEQIRIEHIATSRDVFCHGALRAAAWLSGRGAGRYTIEDAIGFDEVLSDGSGST